MINVLILGGAIALLSFIAAEFTYGTPGRVALDVGLGFSSLAAVGLSIFIGATLISKEVDQRTIYMTLSRSVGRPSFLMGRLLGMSGILILNVFLLSLITYIVTLYFGGSVGDLFGWAVLFILLEALTMLLVVVAFSMLMNTILTIMFSLTTYIGAHAVSETLTLSNLAEKGMFRATLEISEKVLPSFSKLNIKPFLLYENQLTSDYLIMTTAQSLLYIAFLIVVLILIFNKKSLD